MVPCRSYEVFSITFALAAVICSAHPANDPARPPRNGYARLNAPDEAACLSNVKGKGGRINDYTLHKEGGGWAYPIGGGAE